MNFQLPTLNFSACAKLILVGEHAVVYGCPAIAVPLPDLRATVTAAPAAELTIDAPQLAERWALAARPEHPLSALCAATLAELGVAAPDVTLTIQSAIPQASGMGSGAAVATALVRALAALAGVSLPPERVSALVFQSEQRFHGTPSGIDNTVIAFERPVWFVRERVGLPQRHGDTEDAQSIFSAGPLIEPIALGGVLRLLVADTGVRSETRLPVGAVRERRAAEPERYAALFAQVAELVYAARAALAAGDAATLGPLLTQNHALLQQIGVSSPELDRLVEAALAAGALGAKLSGAGWGGVMLALVNAETAEPVVAALSAAGAVRVSATKIAA